MSGSAAILEITSVRGGVVRRELVGSPMVIGRLPECDVQLDSPRVSRRHAELVLEEGHWEIRDLESRNHTWVNGLAVQRRVLGEDDLIEIGQFTLRIVSAADENETVDGHTTNWSTEEREGTEIQRLSNVPARRLNAGHLAKVNSLSQRLVEIGDSRQRLVELCRSLVEKGMGCDCVVALRVEKSMEISGEGMPQLLCGYQVREGGVPPAGISRGVVESAVKGGQPVMAGGAISSGLTVNFLEADRGVTAIIACPLRMEGAWADLVYATVPREYGTLDWLALVTLAAEQWKKAELQIEARKTTRETAAMEQEFKRARKIQMSLVPTAPSAEGLEIAIGFEPCLWIGGDYANVLTAPDGRVNLIVADVSGKGLSAAMVATGVHSIVDGSVRADEPLAEMAQRLNRFFINSMDRQSHLTVLVVRYDPRSGKAEYLNAGHPPVCVVSADGSVRDLRWGHNPPLGVLATSPEIEEVEFGDGELLFLYTDGLSEMYDSGGKMIGVEGTKEVIGRLYGAEPGVSLAELKDKLTRELDEIRGDSPVTDDRTFLLARKV